MNHLAAVHSRSRTSLPVETPPSALRFDPRWQLVQRVISGPHFARSPLLSRFLLFVVAETLEGRGEEISEHQIGVQVFDRPADYRTVEDNIVRNYARQLRKRLADHFADQGSSEPVRIDIPVGGYVPVFPAAGGKGEGKETPHPTAQAVQPGEQSPLPRKEATQQVWLVAARWALRAALFAAYSAALIGVTWLVARRPLAVVSPPEPARALWTQVFGGPLSSYIVPSDAGFNQLEDISSHPVPLADYISGGYRNMPLPGVDARSAANMRVQQTIPFIDLQIAFALARLPENNPHRVLLRFPRDLQLDDLKNANAVIIGSVSSNPWAAIVESTSNFQIVDRPDMSGARIINRRPQPGEAVTYYSRWNEPAHETFALIEFLPNLSGNGHVLVIEGLDAAGTQAAAEMLLYRSAMDDFLKSVTRSDHSLHSFEVLLRSTSIASNATGTQVIASRIY